METELAWLGEDFITDDTNAAPILRHAVINDDWLIKCYVNHFLCQREDYSSYFCINPLQHYVEKKPIWSQYMHCHRPEETDIIMVQFPRKFKF